MDGSRREVDHDGVGAADGVADAGRPSGRWRRLATPASARAIFAVSVLLLLSGLALSAVARAEPDPTVELGGWGDAVQLAMMLPTLVIGVLLASRRPANPVGWIFVGVGLALGWAVFSSGYVEYGAGARPGSL